MTQLEQDPHFVEALRLYEAGRYGEAAKLWTRLARVEDDVHRTCLLDALAMMAGAVPRIEAGVGTRAAIAELEGARDALGDLPASFEGVDLRRLRKEIARFAEHARKRGPGDVSVELYLVPSIGSGAVTTAQGPRFRPDPAATRDAEVARLGALGAVLTELSPGRSSELLARFADEFVDPSRSAHFLEGARQPDAVVDFDRWLRPEFTSRRAGGGGLTWLVPRAPGARCVRFERRVGLTAFEITASSMRDEWASAWPGVFVSFEAGRALAITLDYEELRCDLRPLRATPYR